jgi:hypothetical protein
MVLKFNINSITKNTNDFSCILYFKNEKYNLIIKKENQKKNIELPYLLSRLVPLQNFTFKPRSVLRLLINCKDENSNVSDILFVDRKSYFKKQDENEGNWLSLSVEFLYIFSNPLYDYFLENQSSIKNLEIIPK